MTRVGAEMSGNPADGEVYWQGRVKGRVIEVKEHALRFGFANKQTENSRKQQTN